MDLQVFLNHFNFTEEELSTYFTGPAILPWNRMGNVQGWLGPLPNSWIDQQMQLQLLILERLRSFGEFRTRFLIYIV
jgi:alpha-N-acetylglucosaminidase